MTHRFGLISAVCLVFLVAACGLGTTVEVGPGARVVEGVLGDGVVNEEPCLWVTDEAGARTIVVVPHEWVVRSDPAEIVDDAGLVMARAGDRIRVSGPDGVGQSICGPGSPLFADAIERMAP